MNSAKRFGGVIVALLVILFIVFWYRNDNAPIYTDLSYTDIDGNESSFSSYEGQPLLLIFWATDCPACVAEIPELNAVYDKYTDQGLAMLGISLAHDRPEHIQAMRKDRDMRYSLSWDHDSEISRAFNNVRVTPTHYLINARGEIIMRKIGALDISQLENMLNKIGLN